MRKTIGTPVSVPAQELQIPVHMVVGEELDNGWRETRRRDYCEDRVAVRSSFNPLWWIVALLVALLVGTMFYLAFTSVKDEVKSASTAINAHTDSVGQGINANTTNAAAGVIAQDNVNTSAIRGDITTASTNGINATNSARDTVVNKVVDEAKDTRKATRQAIWAASARTNAAIAAAKPDLSGLAKSSDLSGLASKGDVNTAKADLQAWMQANQAKVTVTSAPSAPAAAPAPAPAPAPAAPVK